MIISTSEEDLEYGQTVRITGTIAKKVLRNGVSIYMMSKPVIVLVSSLQALLLQFAHGFVQKVKEISEAILPPEEALLLLGIVLGFKGTFSQQVLQAFQQTRVMHVIAASGMNMTTTAGFLIAFLGHFLKRQYVALVTIVALIMYCLLAGMQLSIVRPTLMGGLALLAQLWGRQYSGWYALLLAASAMLLVEPVLIGDVGFQLSFASTLGIMTLHPHIAKIPLLNEDIATTVNAQIATLPILLAVFGQYIVLLILVNALVLWTIAPLMILGHQVLLSGLSFSR